MRRIGRVLLGAVMACAIAGCSKAPRDQTRAAYRAAQEDHFGELDNDGDGALSGPEIGRAGPMVYAFDRNGSRTIDRAEFIAGRLGRFDRADRNRDGTVTIAETDANRADRKAIEQIRLPSRR